MREAIGATWIMGIVLAFIALFSGFLAFSVNYSKAFKVKDGIVDRIEKHSGFNNDSVEDINEFLTEIGYTSTGSCEKALDNNSDDGSLSTFRGNYVGVRAGQVTRRPTGNDKSNYCVHKVTGYNNVGNLGAAYYKVYVFFSISLPFINDYAGYNITGETSNLYYPVEGNGWFS